VLAGFLVILFDVVIINWTLTLPQGLGSPVWTGIFTLGVVLIVSSSSLARIAPPVLSKVHANLIEKWEASGGLVTMVDSLSQDETLTLLEFSRKHFGKYVAEAGTTPKGKTWTVKLSKVGSQILPARLEEGRPLFKVILYRRDLASQKGIRRPWRTIYREDTTLQLVKPGPLIELPNWIAD
jgi:hypothetical protein